MQLKTVNNNIEERALGKWFGDREDSKSARSSRNNNLSKTDVMLFTKLSHHLSARPMGLEESEMNQKTQPHIYWNPKIKSILILKINTAERNTKPKKLIKVGTSSISSYSNTPILQNPTGHLIFKALTTTLLGCKR